MSYIKKKESYSNPILIVDNTSSTPKKQHINNKNLNENDKIFLTLLANLIVEIILEEQL